MAGSLQSGPVNDTKPAPPSTAPAAELTTPSPGASEPGKTRRIRPSHAAPDNVAYPKAIKSFVRRAGRTTTGQAKAFEDLGPKFLQPYQASLLDYAACFSTPSATATATTARLNILEIGFGMGEATAHIAGLMPEKNFICCEVHEPGVGALLKRIGEQNLRNIRIVAHDAVEVIDHMLAPSSLDGVHIFFPDPWHKKKHNKRRLIQPGLIAKLAARLKPGGYLHCATDWQPYAEQILEVLSAEPLLRNPAAQTHPELAGYAPKPHYRPLTKFENRGIKLGHGVWDLVFERV
jgi:tRNA (guanine-N7-)-methyltransferase